METARVSRSGSGKTTLTGKVTTNVGGDTEARHPSRKRRHSANVAVESGVHDVDNAVTFGEIEAAMGNLGWSWIPVGIAYIYVAPHAFRQCTAKTFRTFKEGVDYIYTQERFEAYVRDDAALLEKVRLNLQNAKKKSPVPKAFKQEKEPPSDPWTSIHKPSSTAASIQSSSPPSDLAYDDSDDEPLSIKARALRRRPWSPPPTTAMNDTPITDEQSAATTSADGSRARIVEIFRLLVDDCVDDAWDDVKWLHAVTTTQVDPPLNDVAHGTKRKVEASIARPNNVQRRNDISSISTSPKLMPPSDATAAIPTDIPCSHAGEAHMTRLLKHLSAEPLCAIKGDVGSPLLHRESAWHRLKRFVDIGLRSEKTRTLVLHGCDGSGKTSLLRQLKAYAIQMYDNQMATVPDRPVEDGGSGFPSPPPHYKRKLHVVHASTTPRNHMAPVKKPTTTSLNGDGHTAEYLSSDGLFIDVVAAFQVEFGDVCRYDSWTTPARAVWDQVLDSYHVVQTNTSPVYIGRIIFLFVDGLNVYYHDRNILRDLFKAVHAKHNNVVHMIVTTAGPPASLLTVLKSLDLHHRNTVVALPSLNSAALTEILMDRLGPPAVDGVAIREDAVAFVGRLVELVGAGSVSIALAVCRRTLLQKYDALTPTYLAQGNNHSVKCDVVQVGDMVTSAKELFGGDVVTARWVLAALPRVPQLIVYAAVVECGGTHEGVYDARHVHAMYSRLVVDSLHDHLVRSSYDLFRRELDWMVANDLASWNGDVFTLFIPQDEAMSFFHGNLWKNDMCLQSTSKKHNTVRV